MPDSHVLTPNPGCMHILTYQNPTSQPSPGLAQAYQVGWALHFDRPKLGLLSPAQPSISLDYHLWNLK